MKRSLFAIALIAAASVASAASFPDLPSAGPVSVDAKIGFPGLSLSTHGPISERWNWRGDVTYGALDRTGNVDGNEYRAKLKAQYTTLGAEFKPFKGSLYLVGGLAIGKASASLDANVSQTLTYNGNSYTLDGAGTASAEIKSKSNTAVFLGLGQRFGAADKAGFYGGWEAGAYIQRFEAKLAASCSPTMAAADPTTCANLANDVKLQQDKFNSDLKKAVALPSFNVSIGYRF